jgi:uncharacterized protein YqgC (DUF456 family)
MEKVVMMRSRRLPEFRKPTVGTMYDVLAGIMILVPGAVLLALETRIPDVKVLWLMLALCTGMYICALAVNRIRNKKFTIGSFLYKNGGFVLLFVIILYRALSL